MFQFKKSTIIFSFIVIAFLLMAFAPLQENQPPTINDFQDLLYQLASAVVKLAVAAIGLYGSWLVKLAVDKLKTSIGEQQYNWLKSTASTIVSAIAQNPAIVGPLAELTPEKLLVYAVDKIYELCVQYKMPFTKEQIAVLVEDAVDSLKSFPRGEDKYSASKMLADLKAKG